MREVQFEGQTKSKLGSVEARGATEAIFGAAFAAFLEENPDDARAILGKVALAMKSRKAAKAAKDSILRKGALEGLALPGKLADCQTKDASESELFVVEGDSAGGCFDGNTKVALVDGRDISFRQLVAEHKRGKQNYCYTIDARGSVQVAPILHPRMTKKDAAIVEVTLDTGETITCTPDHRFMLRDGTYKEAQSLTVEDSLMPLRRKISEIGGRITIKGYEMVYSPKESYWFFTHVLADRFNIAQGKYERGEKTVIHHKDFNKRNNNPDNLERMDHLGHFFFHTTCLEKTLHSPEAREKSRKVRQSSEFREKIRAIMTQPEMRAMLSKRAKKQWENPEYKEYMVSKFLDFYNSNAEYRKHNNELLNKNQRAYWSKRQNRTQQAERTRNFFQKNPERKTALSQLAQRQWSDEKLRRWRREITKKQWTNEFRSKRRQAYNQTYLQKALAVLHTIWREKGAIDENTYNRTRKETNDRSLIRLDTILGRFFHGDVARLHEAVKNYNHRIVSVKHLSERIEVYDIEVSGTHNFALASGVFVHNSGKMGRDRRTQAVLPLRGKILNIERARLDKMLASEQIKNLVVALGTAIGDVFDISKLRYHKIIIATDADVDGAHIRTLLLTLFYRHFRPIIDGGFLYIAQPPLYKIKKGRESFYAYTEDEKVK
ncbi:MAG: gyrase subunit B protein, partial [Candidatus Kaiserbacteria bacterium GW2011_GWC2_49_12]